MQPSNNLHQQTPTFFSAIEVHLPPPTPLDHSESQFFSVLEELSAEVDRLDREDTLAAQRPWSKRDRLFTFTPIPSVRTVRRALP